MIGKSQVGLTWLGQSAFVLHFHHARVLIDAFLSPHRDRLVPPPFAPSKAVGFDVIASTHEHLDHLDLEALPAMAGASPTAAVIVPKPCVEMVLAAGVPPERVIGIQADTAVEIAGLIVHAVPARHGLHPSDAYSFGEDIAGGLTRFLGYVFDGGPIVYHSGDTIDYDGLADRVRKLRVEVALLPINGRDARRESMDIVGNLDADEAARLAAAAGVKVVVPMHYDMFAANPGYPERLVEAVRTHHQRLTVVVPARGVEFVFSSHKFNR